jgi:hypothetical protein
MKTGILGVMSLGLEFAPLTDFENCCSTSDTWAKNLGPSYHLFHVAGIQP